MTRRELAELIDERLRQGRWLKPQTPQGEIVWCPHPAERHEGKGVRATERHEKVRRRELENDKYGFSHHPARVPKDVVAEVVEWIAHSEYAHGRWSVPSSRPPERWIRMTPSFAHHLDAWRGEKA